MLGSPPNLKKEEIMTLLEMIKKYEDVKGDLTKQKNNLAIKESLNCDIEVVNTILTDLRSILKDYSEISIRNSIKEKLVRCLSKNYYDDALKLIQMLYML